MAMTTCVNCRVEFKRQGNEKYCKACQYIELVCKFCGVTFTASRADHIRRPVQFCSMSCSSRHNRSQQPSRKIIVACRNCGKEYKIFPCRKSSIQYCSAKCRREFRRNNPELYPCLLSDPDFHAAAMRKRAKNKSNIFYKLIGPKHPRWKGGKVGYRGPSWKKARKRAILRDGMLCPICGTIADDVHHIIPFTEFNFIPGTNRNDKLANHPDNLIYLCDKCHTTADRNNNSNLPDKYISVAKSYFASIKHKLP